MNQLLLQALDKILKSRFKLKTQGGSYVLSEPAVFNYPAITIKKVGKVLVYKFPHNVEHGIDIFPLFDRTVLDLAKICDYVIFYPCEKTFFVFLCELKSNNRKGAGKQVEATKILVNYLIEMAQRDLNFKTFPVEYRALIFSTTDTQDSSTNIRKRPAYKIFPSGLKFKLLEAGEDCQLNYHCY